MDRRKFIIATSATGAVATLPAAYPAKATSTDKNVKANPQYESSEGYDLKFEVNSKAVSLKIDSRETLLDVLRERLDLTGSKKGCDHGQCGACTVLVDGKRINSCLSLALQNQGKQILTIEGLASSKGLHPMQQAFIECDAFQCGFCTPGQIMSAVAMMKEETGASREAVAESMSGNICRCGAYANIYAAIERLRGKNAAI